MSTEARPFRFLDLFAGLGGFHKGVQRAVRGAECVLACELNQELLGLYARNFPDTPLWKDVRELTAEEIDGPIDLLCAGFPCQPFSKAGEQLGLGCDRDGDLFGEICRLIGELQEDGHRGPRMLLLENVPNLVRHNAGETWKQMRRDLIAMGYDVAEPMLLSPHQFGVPQIRERVFIAARQGKGSLSEMRRVTADPSLPPTDIHSILLPEEGKRARPMPEHYQAAVTQWNKFIKRLHRAERGDLPSFPIWSMEFGATYPYEGETPKSVGSRIDRYRGLYGASLRGLRGTSLDDALPSYARKGKRFPLWKQDFIRSNRNLYDRNCDWIDPWLELTRELGLPQSLMKLEWNCKGDHPNLWDKVLQFRASGIRAKRPTTTPALVAMTTTQVPIIGWERRYLTPKECLALQSLPKSHKLPNAETRAFRALGNGVNASLVERTVRELRRLDARGRLGIRQSVESSHSSTYAKCRRRAKPVMI